MAKTMYAIEMDFANASRQADELDRIAQSLHNLVNSQFQSCLRGVASDWKGENASTFCQKGNKLGENMKQSVSDLKKTAVTIRTIARNTYLAEKRNFEIAQMRTYRG